VGIGCLGSAHLCLFEAQARHEPRFGVRARLAMKEFLIEIELELDHFGRS
jgi:hypothetical protein